MFFHFPLFWETWRRMHPTNLYHCSACVFEIVMLSTSWCCPRPLSDVRFTSCRVLWSCFPIYNCPSVRSQKWNKKNNPEKSRRPNRATETQKSTILLVGKGWRRERPTILYHCSACVLHIYRLFGSRGYWCPFSDVRFMCVRVCSGSRSDAGVGIGMLRGISLLSAN